VRPLLLMDVDGPLNPFEAPWFSGMQAERGYEFHVLTPSDGQTYWVALNPMHGHRLAQLAGIFDLAWATTWRDDANRLLSPILGLPTDLPVVPLVRPPSPKPGVCWKADQIADWVGTRPFAWFDDEIDETTQEWLRAQAWLGRHHARHISPRKGLTRVDFDELETVGPSLDTP
jgi:hypothetical protein